MLYFFHFLTTLVVLVSKIRQNVPRPHVAFLVLDADAALKTTWYEV